MGKLEETQEAYFGQNTETDLQEKVIVEKDRMSLPHALMILQGLPSLVNLGDDIEEAFLVVFEWIDNMALLLAWERVKEIENTAISDSCAGAPGADQDDRSGA